MADRYFELIVPQLTDVRENGHKNTEDSIDKVVRDLRSAIAACNATEGWRLALEKEGGREMLFELGYQIGYSFIEALSTLDDHEGQLLVTLVANSKRPLTALEVQDAMRPGFHRDIDLHLILQSCRGLVR
jgi:hypothetical protein